MSGISACDDSPLPGLKLTAAIWGLLFARWFIPAEATAEGGTIWLALISWLVAAVWAFSQSRCERPVSCRDHWSLVVGGVIATHLIAVVCAGRSNLHVGSVLFAEWLTVGMSFVMLRSTLLTAARRRAFLRAALAVWLAVAAYGMWQHYVLFPQRAADYAVERAEFDRLLATRPTTAEEAQQLTARISQIRDDWLAQGVPFEGPALGLFERRLRDSSEPTAFFALANSLGGMLASALVMLAVAIASQFSMSSAKRMQTLAVPFVGLAVVAFCLLLTKSRTAWVGTIAGLGVWGCFEFLRSRQWLRVAPLDAATGSSSTTDSAATASDGSRQRSKSVTVKRVLCGLAAIALLVGCITKLGGLDAQVLSEAPKSLRYRLEYWTATARIIAEYPLVGVGPGNFRSHYLQHKLATASEEIADPHSFVFEVLATTGAIGGLALAAFLVTFAATGWRTLKSGIVADCKLFAEDTEGVAHAAIVAAVGIIAGFEFVMQAQWNVDVLIVGFMATALGFVSQQWSFASESAVRLGAVLGIGVLLVHLLGAGGFALPAILGWLLALIAVISLTGEELEVALPPESPNAARVIVPTTPRKLQFIAGMSIVVTLLIAHFIWLPGLAAESFLLQGKLAAQQPGQLLAARDAYQKAHRAAPMQSQPLLNLAEVEFMLSEQTRDEARFQNALEIARTAERRMATSGNVAFTVGRWYRLRFARSHQQDDATRAAEWLQRAVERYPTNPFWNAELAVALRDAGQAEAARTAAQRTLKFEAINQAAGHLDRFLPEDVLRELKSLAPSVDRN